MLGISNKKSVSNKAAEFSQITDTRDKPRKDLGQALAIALVALVAMGMRIAFSYNISANSNFALSGGISSSEHLHRITELVTGQSFIGIDKSLNYPFGSPNTYLALFDLIMVPFVIIERSLGFDTPTSISMTLAWSGAIFGVLCTVSAYFLGKEILKSKKAGFLTSLFIALCPISIAQSIFSNGTGISFLAFLSTIFVYFVFRGIKNYDNFSEYPNFTSILKENKKSLKYALCSGLILSVVALSWSEFRPIVITTIFCMITLVLTDRLTGKDPKVSALFFSVILFTATIVSELYSTSTNLQMPAFPEIFILSTFSAILCLAFSSMHNKPLFTIPTFAILIVAALTVLYYIEPALFYNTILNDSISGEIHSTTTVESCLSLSKIAVFFGPLTMWSPFIVIGIILYSIKNKISSSPYVCAAVLLCFTTKYAIQSTELATIFAPVFAISFAYITIRLFAYINFQSYFTSLKAKGIGLVTRRIFKPIPFLSIFIILAIICSPNALHAIDASIPNNSNEYNGIDSGALGYNIKTDDEWKKNSVLLEYNDVLKCGAMATWVDHADEAAALGDFKVTVDSKGNGAISTSNIFLSKSPSAALLLHGIKCNGFDESKNILLTSGMTEDQFTKIRHCFDSPDKKAIKDIEVYRAIKTDISNESISYLEAENILVDSFSEQELSKLYRKLCNTLGKNIEYIMVTSSMFPISPNKDSSFTALANASGYAVNDQGIIPRFFDVNSEAQETYNYTDAMYETALWKTYIGMSPKEAGKITPHDYLSSLMLSNGKYKTTPGYGLFNYTVDNQHWYVMYNSDPNATLSSSGWVKMTATEAQDKQITNGGLINYLSGFPVILKYTNDSNIDHTINGHVKMGDVPVKGIYAAAMDKNRIIHSYDCTDADGKYEITAHDDQDQKIIFATSIDAFDAENVICTKMYNEISDNPDIMLPTTSLSGRIVGSNDEPLKISSPLKVTFTGRSTGNSLSAIPDHNTKFSFESIVPDTYDITITNESGNSICDTQSYKVIAGANNKDINVKIATCKVTVNTVDDVGVISGDTIIMTEEHGVKFEGTSSNGVAVIDVIPGTYAYSEKHGKIVTHSTSVISSDTSVTIKLHNSKEITINGLGNGTAIIYSKGYLKLCTGNKAYVPVGSGNTATYTLYSVTERGVCLSKIDRNTDEVNLLSLSVPAVEVSGTMMNSSNKAVSGTIIFIKDGMEVPTSSDSRGFYKVLLPEGTYSVYANHGSEVSIVKEFVSVGLKDIKDKNINLSNGTKIFGHTLALSHKLQPVTLSYIPIKVSSITGAEGVSFTTLSGPDGRYSFQIPSYSTCTLTGLINAEDSNYYYDEPIGITKIEKLEISSGETNFEANVKAAEITNNTCGDIWINETLVSAKEHAVIPAKGPTWKVALPYKETPYVTPESIIPVSTTEIIPSHFTNYAFSKLTLVGPTDKSTVTFKTLDGNTILYKTIAKGTQYLIESNKQFNIIVTGPEIGAVHKITKLSEDTVFNISDFNDYSLFHVRGYVGISKPGTLKVLSYNEKEQFESQYDIDSNGRYSIDLSPSYKHKLYAHVLVEDKDKLIHYVYSGQRELDEDFEPEKTYTRDLIVTSQEYSSNDTTISDIHIEKMTANAKSKIDFSFVITNNTGDSTTLLMHPGPGWTDLNFYGSDEFGKRTDEQISSITVDKFAKVHAIGIIDRNTVGLGSDDLSIGITDIQNRMVCIGTLDDDSNWNKTINNTSLVSYGSNSVTDQGYAYSIKIKNCDNFSKKYRIATSEIDNHWFQTLVNGNKIYNIDDDLIIHGYEEATVHVRITTINGKETGVPNANIEISRQNESFSTTDSEGQIQITTNSVIIKSETHKRVIEVCNMFASGEDVYIEGTIWHDIWILIGLVSLIVISLLWPSLKGMLSRRK
ncbi:MAG: hypothetical protein MJY54_00035 [archaeon]|nr:hypothetical protein [archaeon]